MENCKALISLAWKNDDSTDIAIQNDGNLPIESLVGMLEMAKLRLIAIASRQGDSNDSEVHTAAGPKDYED